MPKKLSVTVSGAVSLGSYEAGVMYEIIHAIKEHNMSSATKPDDKILIDILTGASAGGMTATILAQKLMFEAGALDGAYSNSLYQAWVQDVDIEKLLAMQSGDNKGMSILSSKFIEQLSQKYLTARYTSHADVPLVHHPASDDMIHLGLAMTNLNGLDYGVKVYPDEEFVYREFQDKLIIDINNQKDVYDYWNALSNAAVACGAFPFAFRPVDVVRHDFEYKDSQNLLTQIQPTQSFCYTDGGVFNNEPLGLSKNIVDNLDPDHTGSENRFYLFVSPKGQGRDRLTNLNAGNAEFIPFGLQLVSDIYHQSMLQDWIMVEQINQQVDLLDKRAGQLRDLLNGSEDQNLLNSLITTAATLLKLLFKDSVVLAGERRRLQTQYSADYNALPLNKRDVWLDTILVLETAAGLGKCDTMTVLGIISNDSELAGADCFAFGGFFDIKYRKHDYDVGRTNAQKFLNKPDCPLGRLNFTAEPIDAIDPLLNGLKLKDMDKSILNKFYEQVKSNIIDTLNKAGVFGFAAYEIAIASYLRKALGITNDDSLNRRS